MSNAVLPTFPIIDVEIERRPVFPETSIFATVSGKEQRTNWSATRRYEYTIHYPCLRESVVLTSGTYSGQSEIAAVLKHHDDHRGAWDSWLLVDPYGGAQVRVRFVDDSFTMRRVSGGVWEVELSAVSVI